MQREFIVEIDDASYSAWRFAEVSPSAESGDININPISARLFHGDRVRIVADTITVLDSPVRAMDSIAGVLLFTSPPCGRCARTGKMLWRVVPHDRRLPEFVVPAVQKLGFEKHRVNTYVLFAVREWSQTHPEGVMRETIGPVDNLAAFYSYSLHANKLWMSIARASSAVARAKKQTLHVPEYQKLPCDRRTDIAVSYDSPGAAVFDDAIAVRELHPGRVCVSVFIANVCATIDQLDPELWTILPQIAASIYMPNAKHPMLPPALGDECCSLRAGVDRLAMVLDIIVDTSSPDTPRFVEYTITDVALVCVHRNAAFGDPIPPSEMALANIARAIDLTVGNNDMSGVVRFWMRLANTHFASILTARNAPAIFVDELKGGYITEHAKYARITSPIRRAADLANQIAVMFGTATGHAKAFAAKCVADAHWLADMERVAKKVQSVARMVDICSRQDTNAKHAYHGLPQPGGIVFFPELKVWFRDPRDAAEHTTPAYFYIVLFPGAHAPYRKVRIMVVPEQAIV
jgi:exoribonuclease R